MLSGLKGNKEFFTWGYLYEKLRMRLSYDLMKDPIKEKKILKQIRVIKEWNAFSMLYKAFPVIQISRGKYFRITLDHEIPCFDPKAKK